MIPALLLRIVLLALLAAPVEAEEAEPSPLEELIGGEHCVSLTRIDSTHVVDDRSILFYMQGGDVYLNRLPHRCPGLRAGRAFMYRTSLNKLCDLDILTTLNNLGFGFTPGASCGLGLFYPISQETARQLRSDGTL